MRIFVAYQIESMLLSMTGYGRGTSAFGDRNLKVEIKSLNGKMTDVRMRMPSRYREKEILIRKMISDSAIRGKMDVAISVDGQVGEEEFDLNKKLFMKYLHELRDIQDEANLKDGDLIGAVMRFPNVVQSVDTTISEDEWDILKSCIQGALSGLQSFRLTEGLAMEEAIEGHIHNIESFLKAIDPLDTERFEKIRKRINQSLSDHLRKEQIDENRMEQEILFYLEKLDVNEEKVRLAQHCSYFIDELSTDENEKGRKLGFIAQEMGREINTLGAKAQSSDIQKYVVRMKDELEKIKEQMANVL